MFGGSKEYITSLAARQYSEEAVDNIERALDNKLEKAVEEYAERRRRNATEA